MREVGDLSIVSGKSYLPKEQRSKGPSTTTKKNFGEMISSEDQKSGLIQTKLKMDNPTSGNNQVSDKKN